ncbi:putative bifunctional diguanylate cyclase/phosphodiesterase [Rhodoferax sp. UBA5149]|uniref:putative bifunctional diguanylate cyclase/phosphodiesterase n=1 Tax=Rhodoferax sp. UBA5149 TaxID=1947379 RepID=UPI0025DD6180|nr:EAL domain-containing protein [Rhodoferax sp. UBA5149]
MTNNHTHRFQITAGWTLLALAVPLLWWVSHPGWQVAIEPMTFLFWHTFMEIFAVVVAMLIFVTGYRAILSARKGAVVLLGIAFLGVGLLDFLHTMGYAGMPDAMTVNSPHKSIFFWLAARMLAASALLVYVSLPSGPEVTELKKRLAVALMLAAVGVLGFVGLLWPDRVPALFVPGEGLTPLKIGLEWTIITIDLMTLGMLWRRREKLVYECVMALAFAVALSAVSELFVTMLGVIDKDAANVLGHIYKVAAYLFLFHATFNEALRRPLERMTAQHLREKVTLNAAPDGVLWVDNTGRILMANPAMEVLTGYPENELVGQNVDLFLPEHLRARHAQSMRGYFMTPHPRAMGLMDLKLLRRDGQLLPVDISLGHWEDEGARHAIAYVRDLSERKKFEESLRYQATHDELTGLPNRWLFRLQLGQALARAGRSDLRVAVLLLDLDYFKTVNDSFGHATGDALLVQVGARIRGVLRENDLLARLGGDEFAILLADLADVDEAVSVATKLLASLQASYRLQDEDVYSSGSLGLVFYPDDAQDSDTLLRYADMAMYQAKQAGRGTYACYSMEMDRRVHEDMQLHTRLKEALAQGMLQLHYQPQVGVQSGEIVGAEALLRWHDEVLGDVSPARFIPVAEATGLILPLSDWVLETACEQIAAWAEAGTPLRVAINVSAQQFRQRDLPEKVRAALARSGVQAEWLDIEITESVAMTQPEQAREQLHALVALGCRVSLDDFGTGYSSLAYLKALPVSKLKIDKSFMDGIPDDAGDATISRAIIALAHSLGMTLVAEGVETEVQLDFLRQYGCEVYQGWLFAKAMKAEELTALIPRTGRR